MAENTPSSDHGQDFTSPALELEGDCLLNISEVPQTSAADSVSTATPLKLADFIEYCQQLVAQHPGAQRVRSSGLPGNRVDWHRIDPDAVLVANRVTDVHMEDTGGFEAPGFCILRVRLEGALDEDFGGRSHRWEGANSSIICLGEGFSYRFRTIRRAPLFGVSLLFRLSWLHRVTGDKAGVALKRLEQALAADDSAAHVLQVNVDSALIGVTRRLLEHFEQERIEPLVVHVLSQELLAYALLNLEAPDERTESTVLLREADMQQLEAIKARLDEQITARPSLEELSHWAGMNRNKLNTGFRMLYGSSVGEYGRQRCLELARQLLSQGERVGEVADRVGYQDQGSFTKAFKQAYGVTPSTYRSNP